MEIPITAISCGLITVHMPDASQSKFFIFQDLSEILGVEDNYLAEKKIRRFLKLNAPDSKVFFDSEADNCAIYTLKADSMVSVLKAIKIMSVSNLSISDSSIMDITEIMTSWERPKAQKWRTGDIFVFLLDDGVTKAYGQVLILIKRSGAVCALFGDKYSEKDKEKDKLLDPKKILSIVQINTNRLNTFQWEVIGNEDVAIEVTLSPQFTNHYYASHMFHRLANAHFGIVSWQNYYEDMLWKQSE
ncbi:Imm26 family immunity protein [Paenibacillus prosopidis]|uniref:Immunity protein 26 of polymorphic toxin system n=1 Tax=Paenibacillus prosopidis TaxID=630520 RepID=A0A368VJT4_9BACL|nr:Imm26 family immunity protein [Paenibacillus prosopidis]RCW39917.1 immunity protein 26 of polymorphic toxin system [Paenibacillus prosopidis]